MFQNAPLKLHLHAMSECMMAINTMHCMWSMFQFMFSPCLPSYLYDEMGVWLLCKLLIMKDGERNHSMGSPMNGTPSRSEDRIEILRSKTMCAVTIWIPLKWQRERMKGATGPQHHWQPPLFLPLLLLCSWWLVMKWVLDCLWSDRLSLIWWSLSGLRTMGESRSSNSLCCDFPHYFHDQYFTQQSNIHFINSHQEQSNKRGRRRAGCRWVSRFSGRALAA